MNYANHNKIDLQHFHFIKKFLYKFVYIYKMSKNSSAKCYQNNKERPQKKVLKDIKVFLKKEKGKNENMVVNDTKIYLKMKNKSLLIIEKIL